AGKEDSECSLLPVPVSEILSGTIACAWWIQLAGGRRRGYVPSSETKIGKPESERADEHDHASSITDRTRRDESLDQPREDQNRHDAELNDERIKRHFSQRNTASHLSRSDQRFGENQTGSSREYDCEQLCSAVRHDPPPKSPTIPFCRQPSADSADLNAI